MTALEGLTSLFGAVNVQGNSKLRTVAPLMSGLTHVSAVTLRDVQCVTEEDREVFLQTATAAVDVQTNGDAGCERYYADNRTTVGSGPAKVCGGTGRFGAGAANSASALAP